MRAEITHLEGYAFKSVIRGHEQIMDIRRETGGSDRGPSPKETLIASILGCTGMDVVAYLGKYKVSFDSLKLTGDAQTVETQPKVFIQVDVCYELTGKDLPVDKVKTAVEQSMTRYCGVSAMVSRVSPIYYSIVINGEIEHRGQAKFAI